MWNHPRQWWPPSPQRTKQRVARRRAHQLIHCHCPHHHRHQEWDRRGNRMCHLCKRCRLHDCRYVTTGLQSDDDYRTVLQVQRITTVHRVVELLSTTIAAAIQTRKHEFLSSKWEWTNNVLSHSQTCACRTLLGLPKWVDSNLLFSNQRWHVICTDERWIKWSDLWFRFDLSLCARFCHCAVLLKVHNELQHSTVQYSTWLYSTLQLYATCPLPRLPLDIYKNQSSPNCARSLQLVVHIQMATRVKTECQRTETKLARIWTSVDPQRANN